MKLAALGDSIIRGVILKAEGMRERYTLSDKNIVDRCAESLNSEVVNLGKMGCTVEAGERILDKFTNRLQGAQYVLLEYGGNDSDYDWNAIAQSPDNPHTPRTPIDVYERTYDRVVGKVRQAGCIPLVLSLPPMDAERYFRFFTANMQEEQKSNVLQWLCGSTNTIMSGHELYNMATWKVAQRTGAQWIDVTSDLLIGHRYRDYLCDDGIHPNEQGQARIAELILNALHR